MKIDMQFTSERAGVRISPRSEFRPEREAVAHFIGALFVLFASTPKLRAAAAGKERTANPAPWPPVGAGGGAGVRWHAARAPLARAPPGNLPSVARQGFFAR